MLRPNLLLLAALLLVASACAAQPAAPPPTGAATFEPLPAQNTTDTPPTATTDPLMATMELLTMPPLSLYESPRFAYSFRYPLTSEIDATADGESIWIDRQILIRVTATDPELNPSAVVIIDSVGSTFVNGVAARRISGRLAALGGSTSQNYESIVISANNRFYIITAYELRNDVQLPADRERGPIPLTTLSIFDTILGTFVIRTG
jgi:hypothetical protein